MAMMRAMRDVTGDEIAFAEQETLMQMGGNESLLRPSLANLFLSARRQNCSREHFRDNGSSFSRLAGVG
jgi:hypothetical protein